MFCPVCRSDYPSDWKACPTDAVALLKSAQIGKYTIEGLLGVGGMGAVYRASNPDTKGRVAIKVMNPAVAGAESARVRFQREAAAVAALNTTHVVKVYDFGTEADGALYLVMELLDGHPLRDEIAPQPRAMDLARVQMVMDGALRGLAAAHKAGIVHRDLKPENVFVAQTDDGEVPKLVDFGIARVRTHDSDLTRTGTLVGTASYMSPEQIAAGMGDIGPWSDVYSMGTILYELLSGTAAFGGDTITSVLQRVLRCDIEPLEQVRPGLAREIYRLVERCMSSDPTARPQDADALRRELASARLVTPGTPIPVARLANPDANGSVELAHTQAPTPVAPSASGLALTQTPVPETKPQRPPSSPAATLPEVAVVAPAKRALWPIALGVAALGGGLAIAFAVSRDGNPALPAPADAAIAAAPSAVIDAAVVLDAGTPDAARATRRDSMVAIAGGTHEIGVRGGKGDDLRLHKVTLPAYWIDRHEMTKDQLVRALGDKVPAATRQKLAGDTPTTPVRFVDWATAAAACAAVGKRLPTEAEWEVAARSTPQDAARARLRRMGTDADLAAASTDCSADGLCDMLGSLLEWTSTRWATVPRHPVVRGMSYRFAANDPQLEISIHHRQAIDPKTTDNELGFRCAAAADELVD